MSDAKAKITLGGDTAIELDVLKGTLVTIDKRNFRFTRSR